MDKKEKEDLTEAIALGLFRGLLRFLIIMLFAACITILFRYVFGLLI